MSRTALFPVVLISVFALSTDATAQGTGGGSNAAGTGGTNQGTFGTGGTSQGRSGTTGGGVPGITTPYPGPNNLNDPRNPNSPNNPLNRSILFPNQNR
jgi:hypothetical protein